MNTVCVLNRKFRPGFLNDLVAFLDREGFVDLVLESQDLLAFIFVTDPALERHVATRRIVGERVAKFVGFDPLVTNTHRISLPPPAETAAQRRHR